MLLLILLAVVIGFALGVFGQRRVGIDYKRRWQTASAALAAYESGTDGLTMLDPDDQWRIERQTVQTRWAPSQHDEFRSDSAIQLVLVKGNERRAVPHGNLASGVPFGMQGFASNMSEYERHARQVLKALNGGD